MDKASGQPGTQGAVEDGQGTTLYRAYVLFVLLLVYILSYLDRVLAGIAAPAIRAELHLTDLQIGLVNGAAFSVPFIICCLVLGWLADRHIRVRIIAMAVAVWSLSTVAFGAGRSFCHLLVARAALGLGEAGGNVASIPILIDYFPRRQLARAMAILAFGLPLGTSGGIILGAVLVTQFGWRGAFFSMGAISLVTAPLLLMTVREPRRRGDAGATAPVSLFAGVRAMLLNSSFMVITIATSISSISTFAIFFWLPSFFLRKYVITLSSFAGTFGTLQLVAGIFGAWLGGYLADSLAKRTQAAYSLVPGIGYLMAAPLVAGVMLAPSAKLALALLFATMLLQALAYGPITVAYQRVTPPALRATAQSVLNSLVVCAGMGLGLPLLGALSDKLRAANGDASLGYAMLTLPVFYFIAAALFLYESKRIHLGIARVSTLVPLSPTDGHG